MVASTISALLLAATAPLGVPATPPTPPTSTLVGSGTTLSRAATPALARIECTPKTIKLSGEDWRASPHPIAEALTLSQPGTHILLTEGTYEPFTIGFSSNAKHNARTAGGRRGLPVVVEGRGRVVIRSGGDTIAIDQRVPNGWITFKNLRIQSGERAGVMFFVQPPERVHRGYVFEDCDIIGTWSPFNDQGRNSKWGLSGYQMADFQFVGRTRRVRVSNIKREHAFYIRNPVGSILIDNVQSKYLGRTFCQFTAREGEGLEGKGDITVRNCQVVDVGIAKGDGYKGGSAFTVSGRLTGTIRFERNTYRAGFDSKLKRLTRPGQPYGTGAFVAWIGKQSTPNGTLILRDNDFRFAPGCGDRAVVSIGGCKRVEITGLNRFDSGGARPALVLDPRSEGGRLISPANGSVLLSSTTRLGGELWIGNDEAEPSQLARMRR